MGRGLFNQIAGKQVLRRRLAAAAILVALALALALLLRSGDDRTDLALEFAGAWEAQDFGAMHATLTPGARAEYTAEELRAAHEQAQQEATATGIGIVDAGSPIESGGGTSVPVTVIVRTNIFGDITGSLLVPVADDGVRWEPRLVFPGLEQGEGLRRETVVPERGAILASDGSVISSGPPEARSGEIPGASQIAGTVGVQTDEQLAESVRERGFPDDALVGTTGLELIVDEIVAGRPGGRLLASGPEGGRILARAPAKTGRDVRTTIDPAAQAAVSTALGSQFGGIALLSRRGAIRGLAGLAFSAPQPPGSTFKMITAAAALESGESSPGEEFPVTTGEVVGGREIENAHDELCGGTLVESFAHSCNSVFAPLGVRVGAEQLVETAESLGFNEQPDLLAGNRVASGTAEPSTIPEDFESELDLGVSAIGQGRVLATPLGMASVAQAIANDGQRVPPFVYSKGGSAQETRERAVSAKTARQLTAMMEAVVAGGTATSAQIPGIRVAGKTGTAELGPKPGQELPAPDPDNPDAPVPELEMEVDAWFAAFAPADRPRYAISVMLVNADGDGGEVAAPIAREVLSALLG